MRKLLMIILSVLTLMLSACNGSSNPTQPNNTPNAQSDYEYKLDIDNKVTLRSELVIEKIKDGVFVVSHAFPWDANSMILEMQTGEIVLIDTPYENEATNLIVEWIRANVSDDAKIIAINTGYHFDNLGGNKYLKSQNIKIIATTMTSSLISKNGEEARQMFLDWLKADNMKKYHDVYKTLEYVQPTETYELNNDEVAEIQFGNESLILYYPEKSHAPDNIIVYYPQKKVLFGGCMIKDQKADNLGNTADASIEGWKNSITKLLNKYSQDDVDIIVPGHGDIGDYSLLDKTKTLLDKYK